MLKKILLPVFALFWLSGCAAPSNDLILNPTITDANPDPTMTAQAISISANDARQDKALAKVNRNGKLLELTAAHNPAYLMQDVIDRQMRDRGYTIDNGGNADNIAVQVTINKLFADVQEGNLRHSINTAIDIAIVVDAKNGTTYTKNYRTSHTIDGAFSASNGNIAKAIDQTLTEIIAVMAKDPGIHEFIQRNSR